MYHKVADHYESNGVPNDRYPIGMQVMLEPMEDQIPYCRHELVVHFHDRGAVPGIIKNGPIPGSLLSPELITLDKHGKPMVKAALHTCAIADVAAILARDEAEWPRYKDCVTFIDNRNMNGRS